MVLWREESTFPRDSLPSQDILCSLLSLAPAPFSRKATKVGPSKNGDLISSLCASKFSSIYISTLICSSSTRMLVCLIISCIFIPLTLPNSFLCLECPSSVTFTQLTPYSSLKTWQRHSPPPRSPVLPSLPRLACDCESWLSLSLLRPQALVGWDHWVFVVFFVFFFFPLSVLESSTCCCTVRLEMIGRTIDTHLLS